MGLRPLRFYYLATPVFFILHYLFGVELRVSIPAVSEQWLYLYYLLCFVAGLTLFRHELAGAWFSLTESAVNIVLLLLGVLMPVFNAGRLPAGGGSFDFGVNVLLHFLIVGSALLYSFYMNPLILQRAGNRRW